MNDREKARAHGEPPCTVPAPPVVLAKGAVEQAEPRAEARPAEQVDFMLMILRGPVPAPWRDSRKALVTRVAGAVPLRIGRDRRPWDAAKKLGLRSVAELKQYLKVAYMEGAAGRVDDVADLPKALRASVDAYLRLDRKDRPATEEWERRTTELKELDRLTRPIGPQVNVDHYALGQEIAELRRKVEAACTRQQLRAFDLLVEAGDRAEARSLARERLGWNPNLFRQHLHHALKAVRA